MSQCEIGRCSICMTNEQNIGSWESTKRCIDRDQCAENIFALVRPVRDMDHPALMGLPEIARDAIARAGDPILMICGGSLKMSDLCKIVAAEAIAEYKDAQ